MSNFSFFPSFRGSEASIDLAANGITPLVGIEKKERVYPYLEIENVIDSIEFLLKPAKHCDQLHW